MNKAHKSEQNVIGGILLRNDCLEDVSSILQPEDFNDVVFRDAFEGMLKMNKNGQGNNIDPISLSSNVKNISNCDFESVLFQAINETVTPANITVHADIVKQESKKRKVLIVTQKIQRMLAEDKDDAIDFALNELNKIDEDDYLNVESYSETIPRTIEQIYEDAKRGNNLAGISSGFKSIDDFTYGFQKGQLIILGARPSVGKTTLGLNIANNVGVESGLPVAFISLEMPVEQLNKRTLSQYTSVKSEILFRNIVNEEHLEEISESIDDLIEAPVFICDKSNMTVRDIKTYCRQIKKESGLSLVVIDYLGLISGEGETETIKIGRIANQLKQMARSLEVPVLCLCQLNRESSKGLDTTPRLHDLRQSGEIEQHADVVMLLEKLNQEKIELQGKIKLHFAKVRNGKCGEVYLRENLNHMRFEDIE